MAEVEDTEITLGTGKLLAMFFALVVICAVFFALGYSLGRSATRPADPAAEVAPPAVPASSAAKPGASKAAAPAPAAQGADELTFYKSVEQNDAHPQLPAAGAPQSPATTSIELTKPAPGALVVQVAAVSKQEDADILVTALKRKQYPVFVTAADTDKLFHVQVGPFSDAKEAEAMKARLTSDGYSPILKR